MKPQPITRTKSSAREMLALTALLASGSAVAAETPAQPQDASADQKKESETQTLGEMVVEAIRDSLYKPEKLQSTKYTVPLRDVPQTVTVIPKEVIKEQGATSLRDVLKNVPGITMQAGEGGVPNGDNLSIRGFNARTDMFVDGVRDFGGYSRDPFNIEQVEVAKGPASANNGRGSTGGSVNLESKTPKLKNIYDFTLAGGTDEYGRATFDVNQPITELQGAAFRVNGMYHTQDTPGRDHVEQERWGIAPSIAFGLGTETRETLSYFHLDQDNMPDNGIPWVPRTSNNTGLKPGIPDVDFDNWYGLLDRDYEEIATDMLTSTFEHDFNEKLKLRDVTRFGRTDRDSITTSPRFDNSGLDAADVRRSDWKTRDQVDTILTNIIDLRYDFETGKVKHELVGGLELTRETSKNYNRVDDDSADIPNTDLEHPNPHSGPAYNPSIHRDGAYTDATADTVAVYAFDTIKLDQHWQLSGGVRLESFDIDYLSHSATGVNTPLDRRDDMFSYRGAITYKPQENGSIYLGYGTSFNPSAEGLTLANTATATNNINVDPEESHTIELGTKWDLFDNKLALTAAIFRTDKTNARTENPADNTDVIVLDGEQRVQGFEFGFTGTITDKWRLLGGYTFLDSEVLKSNNPLEVGNELMNTPDHSFNLWSVHTLPYGFEVGGGVQFTDERFNNSRSDTRQLAPDFLLFDAMISYKLNEHVTFRLNGYNLTDEDYIDRLGGGHFVPGTGRSFVLSTNFSF